MESKIIEIRDRTTRIDVLATKMVSGVGNILDATYLNHNGYDENLGLVLVTKLDNGERSSCDPYNWDDSPRTMQEAHKYIQSNFDKIPNHWVLDVETILGEKEDMKIPERYNRGLFSIVFKIKSIIELSDIDAVCDILRKEYKLEVLSSYLDDDFKNPKVEISKQSIKESGLKFYEVLNQYLELIY